MSQSQKVARFRLTGCADMMSGAADFFHREFHLLPRILLSRPMSSCRQANDCPVRSRDGQAPLQGADSPTDGSSIADHGPTHAPSAESSLISPSPSSSEASRGSPSQDGSYTSLSRLAASVSATGLNQRLHSGRRSQAGSYISNDETGRPPASIRSTGTPGGARSLMQMRRTPGTSSRKAFISTRLKGEIAKPWLEHPDPAQKWARWIIIGSLIVGLAIIGIRKFFLLT